MKIHALEGQFSTVVADPPWPYETSKTGRFAIPKPWEDVGQVGVETMGYGVMSIPELCALPVASVATPNAHLYLWTTNAFMVEAHEVARTWGFTPKTILTWVKTRHDDPAVPSMKTGYYFRGATEHVVFAVRGSCPLRVKEGIPTAFLSPRINRHSEKPDSFYRMVQRVSPAYWLEMFARTTRPGWSSWGDQCEDRLEVMG